MTYLQKDSNTFKPIGLWYAIDGAWIEWCKNEMPHWIKKHEITLEIDMSRVLIIKTVKDLNEFIKKYTIFISENINGIYWRRVATDYDGIEIQNYRKLKWSEDCIKLFCPIWFSGWDVSGGCIWNLLAIKSYKVTELEGLKK
jgi:hypothetical protein